MPISPASRERKWPRSFGDLIQESDPELEVTLPGFQELDQGASRSLFRSPWFHEEVNSKTSRIRYASFESNCLRGAKGLSSRLEEGVLCEHTPSRAIYTAADNSKKRFWANNRQHDE